MVQDVCSSRDLRFGYAVACSSSISMVYCNHSEPSPAQGRRYMPLADLTKAMGTRSFLLIDKLADVDVVGAKKLPSGAQPGALIRMADLGKSAIVGLQVSGSGLSKLHDYA